MNPEKPKAMRGFARMTPEQRREIAARGGKSAATYKIDRSRLQTIGIGPVSPRSSNLTSEGKAKNRRVEMVLN